MIIWNTVISVILIYVLLHRDRAIGFLPAFMGRANGEENKDINHELTLGIFYGIFGGIMLYTAARVLRIYLKNRKGKTPVPTERQRKHGVKPACTKSYILEIDEGTDLMSLPEPKIIGCRIK